MDGVDKLRQLRLAKDAMDRDWADRALDLDAVAAHAGYSRYHFLRAFKADQYLVLGLRRAAPTDSARPAARNSWPPRESQRLPGWPGPGSIG